MSYEQKKVKVAQAVIEAVKFAIKDENPKVYTKSSLLKSLSFKEVESLLKQFEADKRLKITEMPSMMDFDANFDPHSQSKFEIGIKVLDLDYFKSLLPRKSGMKVLQEIQEDITGLSAKERAEIRALENTSTRESNKYHIVYNDSKVLMLNGKIDIGKPQFGRDSQTIFQFLYDNPNKVFTKKQIEESTKVDKIESLTKIVERLGFKRGLKAAFFDIHEGAKKQTIKFKNPVTL